MATPPTSAIAVAGSRASAGTGCVRTIDTPRTPELALVVARFWLRAYAVLSCPAVEDESTASAIAKPSAEAVPPRRDHATPPSPTDVEPPSKAYANDSAPPRATPPSPAIAKP